jgi:phage tail sheath protein FI
MPVTTTYPGVYIEEIPSGVRTITGVATSITAFIGRALFGPVNEPTIVTSFAAFDRAFGGLAVDYPMSYAVRDFYLNGGSMAVIVRLFSADGLGDAGLNPDGVADFGISTLQLVAASPGAWANDLRVRVDNEGITQEVADRYGLQAADLFNLSVYEIGAGGPASPDDGPLRERHINLTIEDSPRRIDRVLAQQSSLVSAPAVPGTAPTPDSSPSAFANGAGGGDSAPLNSSADFLGASADDKEGLYALLKADLFNILCIPPDTRDGDVPAAVYQAAMQFCTEHRAMLIVDPPVAWGANPVTAAANAVAGLTTLGMSGTAARNAALYFPRVRESDTLREDQLDTFVPCGIIAGVWARTDLQRGVWKAPAGLDAALNGIQGLQVNLTDPENGLLNPLGINCLRAFPVNGRVVWGARTLRGADQLADEYKYIPVRRLALYIEESLYRGTQWVVFEPNDEPLWAQIRLNVGAFMQNLFRQGAFQGRTPREAFLVKCDKETTTQNDINLGIVNIVVGFAPLKPAEFVIIKIQQLAGQVEA